MITWLAGAAAVTWGTIEAALRLRLMLRPGLRARLRGWESLARTRLREWTFFVVVTALAGSVLAAGLVRRPAPAGGGVVAPVAGIALIVCGAALRVWAIVTLDRFFTFIVGVTDGQSVVKTGPYRRIRHPGYAGAMVALIGIGIALGSWISVLILTVVPALAFAVRIRVEESTLIAGLGEEYLEYARSTAGMIPGVW